MSSKLPKVESHDGLLSDFKTPLFTVPLEIREQIYTLVMYQVRTEIEVELARHSCATDLLCTSKQINQQSHYLRLRLVPFMLMQQNHQLYSPSMLPLDGPSWWKQIQELILCLKPL